MLDTNLLKAVKLPEKDAHIIATIYHHWKITGIQTGKVYEDREWIFTASGEMSRENSNAFMFWCNFDGEDDIEIPLCGYLKEEYIEKNFDEGCPEGKVEFEWCVLDYVTLSQAKIRVRSRNGILISDTEEGE